MRRKKPQQRLRNIHDINVFADWLGNKEFDNDGTLNCVLGAEGHIAVLDAVHGDGIGGHCAITAAGVCPLCVNDGIGGCKIKCVSYKKITYALFFF